MHRYRSSFWLIACLFPACGPTTAAPDASGHDVVANDATTDADPGPTTRLFAHCATDADCHGGTCHLAWPGGLCSQTCTSDAECGPGLCATLSPTVTTCRPQCTPGGLECDAYGGVCDTAPGAIASGPTCVFNCSTLPLAGAPTCNTGRTCDPYLDECVTTASTGADDGAPCATAADCRSTICLTEVDTTGAPTGWIGGYCLSYARYPSPSSLQIGQPLPQSNCPAGAVIYPAMTAVEGDSELCLHGCMADTDCRAGYSCQGLRDGTGAVEFTVGLCAPADCTQPGSACPAGYACQILPGAPGGAGSCVSMASGDGGVGHDGGT